MHSSHRLTIQAKCLMMLDTSEAAVIDRRSLLDAEGHKAAERPHLCRVALYGGAWGHKFEGAWLEATHMRHGMRTPTPSIGG
jgi:hypothetical protein